MRRIVVGFLILFCITLTGIFVVESNLTSSTAAAAGNDGGDRRLKLTIGGEITDVPPAVPRTAPKVQPRAKSENERPWQVPEPTLSHVVKKGDTLSKIANAYLGTGSKEAIERILKANRLKSAKELKIDTKLSIPVLRFEKQIADGRRTVKEFAKHFYGDEEKIAPLRNANPNLPLDPDSKVPPGFTVFAPR